MKRYFVSFNRWRVFGFGLRGISWIQFCGDYSIRNIQVLGPVFCQYAFKTCHTTGEDLHRVTLEEALR